MKHNKEGVILNGMYYIWEHGYFSTGINDILKSCEIPKGSFYNMFESKEDFCVEVLGLYCNIMQTSMNEFLSDTSFAPFDRLKNFYLNQLEIMVDNQIIKGCMMCNLSLELGSYSKKIRKELTKHLQTNLAAIEKCMTEIATKGGLAEDIEPLQAATFIQNNWFGAILKTKGTGKVDAINDFLEMTFDLLENKYA